VYKTIRTFIIAYIALFTLSIPAAEITGELKKWHKVTITFDGPEASETGNPNPFLNYRLKVTFTNGSATYVVPGYFAADGDAANSSAEAGKKWRAHFAPDKTGTWTYTASFRTGADVAVSDDVNAGTGTSFDGETGTFDIGPTDKTGRDHRGKGRLCYIGEHYLQFAEKGEYFLKQGADAPENFLSYEDFDGDFKSDGKKDNLVKKWEAHVKDWKSGDPTWKNGLGKGMIGAVNYIASEGLNVISFLTLNINGDDQNVFPYLTYNERNRLDVSRLAQWEVVFEHMDKMGIYLHFKTQETENEMLLDNGNTGTLRKLYYRELIARFSHHLALNWNLGEENGSLGDENQNTQQRIAMAKYFHDHDPYKHHIVIHNGKQPDDLLGNTSKLTGYSLQTNQEDFSNVFNQVTNWVKKSADAGKKWVVACDEPGDAQHSLRPDDDAGNSHVDGRKNGLWGTIMGGGAGNEWYFGYDHAHSDLNCQDWRSRDKWWDYCRYALEFFKKNNIPFWEMTNNNGLSSNNNDYCFFKAGVVYVVYLKNGGTTNLDLSAASGKLNVKWYDPRNGGDLQDGSVKEVTGGGQNVPLGNAPGSTGSDWVILVRNDAVSINGQDIKANSAQGVLYVNTVMLYAKDLVAGKYTVSVIDVRGKTIVTKGITITNGGCKVSPVPIGHIAQGAYVACIKGKGLLEEKLIMVNK